MTNVTFYPHCSPIQTHADFRGSFESPEDAISYARSIGCSVVQRYRDTNSYQIAHVTVVKDGDIPKYAFGRNVGRNCDCLNSRRSKHHTNVENKRECVDPFPLLNTIDDLFVPVAECSRGYENSAWLITDAYRTRTLGETGPVDDEREVLSKREKEIIDRARSLYISSDSEDDDDEDAL
jgi:hypothetical protein